ncbi:hypothetical protein FMUND_11147 [Fusarium mundagurra]|uniref:Uncharacterized protein n=1 Tax=Fusarium mundagurra TaxID=1567541 RepID=A0A8H5Y899_9HYPO|nr:hypothetical protein FMUND_11147 [Fusarium mundagurra]
MSGTEARLYISWKRNELDYCMANVDSFLLQDPEHYHKFRKYVRNIIDWGRGGQLEGIRKSMDSLLEEIRKTASAAAKSRMPPSVDSPGITSTSSSKTCKTSSARQKSGRRNSIPGQTIGAEGGKDWEWDVTIERWFHRNTDGTLSWAEEGEQRPGMMLTGQA